MKPSNTPNNEFKKEQFNLMKQKGIYPYDHMDSFDRFNETKLPVKAGLLQYFK